MLTVTSIKVLSFDLDYLDVFWELQDTAEEVERYDFYILRSVDGMAGPYEELAGPFYNTFLFRDSNVRRFHLWRNYFYKLRIVERASGDERSFGPAWLQAPPDLIAMEIRRREALLFKEFAGRLLLYYPVITSGQRCGNCWDLGTRGNTIGRPVQQNCVTCFGTTFVKGFSSPFPVFAQIDPSAKLTQRTELEEQQFVETTGRTTAFPPMKSKDMLIEGENIRWRVKQVTPTEKGRAIVRQELVLRRYPQDDVKYKVPVNFDVLTEFSPARERSRPMTLAIPAHEQVDDLTES